MDNKSIIKWLLEGDVSIQNQVHLDLLSTERKDLQDRIEQEGWGVKFLSKRNSEGHWGRGFYQPKSTSSHYTLLELRGLCISTENVLIKEFILLHQLFISDRTEKIINKDFLRFSYPRRWHYDILSALDYFQYSETKCDNRIQPALDYLLKKRNKEGIWNVNAKHPGQTHFDMEKAGKPSRWNTLRALRVL